MTSGLQPFNAGAPQPVMGVTGGPGINSGTASVDPGSGALVFHPQPANVVQVRGSTPGAFQVYEYFHTNTDFSRLTLEAQAGGPFIIAVETDPTTVIRDLDINTPGNVVITPGGSISLNGTGVGVAGNFQVNGASQFQSNVTIVGTTQFTGNITIGAASGTAYTAPPVITGPGSMFVATATTLAGYIVVSLNGGSFRIPYNNP